MMLKQIYPWKMEQLTGSEENWTSDQRRERTRARMVERKIERMLRECLRREKSIDQVISFERTNADD